VIQAFLVVSVELGNLDLLDHLGSPEQVDALVELDSRDPVDAPELLVLMVSLVRLDFLVDLVDWDQLDHQDQQVKLAPLVREDPRVQLDSLEAQVPVDCLVLLDFLVALDQWEL
jgi:hypothetical protein